MASVPPIEIVATALFALAVVHTFATRWFDHLAHASPRHSGLWHLLGEIEVAFGFWALVLLLAMAASGGWSDVTEYMGARHFTEPVFVFVVMVIAASRPILQLARATVAGVGRLLPLSAGRSEFVLALSLVPLMGSLITEPAAMTVAALMLRDGILSRGASTRLKYATLGVLFVNVSIGGTLTHFAAPPVLMVASVWEWTTPFMFATFGWKAVLAVVVNATLLATLFRGELRRLGGATSPSAPAPRVPAALVTIHAVLLFCAVTANQRPEIFLGIFLLFLGLAEAYGRHHDRLVLREALMVGFFLAGLVVLGGQQGWWLGPLLASLDGSTLFLGTAALTAVTDNAALTYLGSQVPGLSESLRYSLVAGAVAGGGLTVIANAPNPAGWAILEERFEEGSINPFGLVVAALPPTLVALMALRAPGELVMEVHDLAGLRIWLAELDRGILFLFMLPFIVAAFSLLAEWTRLRRNSGSREVGRSAEEPEAAARASATPPAQVRNLRTTGAPAESATESTESTGHPVPPPVRPRPRAPRPPVPAEREAGELVGVGEDERGR